MMARRISPFAILGVSLMLLSACQSLRDEAGLTKQSPDEFAVTTKAPLIVPPDFNLHPPSPGAAPLNQTDPTSSAEVAMFSTNDPTTVAASMSGSYTAGERMLLANAGVQNTDPTIRAQLQSDEKNMQGADSSFTDRILEAPPRQRRFPKAPPQPAKAAAAGLTGSRRALTLLLLAAALSSPVVAAPSAPQPAAQTFQFSLPNGMQVLVIPDHRAPVVTQMLWFKVGAVDDPPGISGLAHFFEHMMFRGTKQVPGDLYAQTIAKNGGEDNAFTTHDYTAFL